MKHVLLWPALAICLFLGCTHMVGAKARDLAEYTQYDVTGDGQKDNVLITMETDTDVYNTTVTIYVNEKEYGAYQTGNNKDFFTAKASLEKTSSGDYFVLVNGTQAPDEAYFVLFQYVSGKFKVVLTTGQVFQAKKYVDECSSIAFQEGKDQMVVTSLVRSSSLCTSYSRIYYQVKNHQLVKKSKSYKTQVYMDSFVVARKLKVYQKPNGKTKTFTLKKKDQVKVTKVYDSKALWIYVTRLSDKKSGWIKGIELHTGNPLFVGVEYPDWE